MHRHRDHEQEHDRIRIQMGGGSVPGGSSDFLRNPSEVLERRPRHWTSDHALAALRELRKMLTWIESQDPRAD